MTNASKIFSERLKAFLANKAGTASEIARKAGLTSQAILNYANGKNDPTLGNADKIAKALGHKGLGDFLRGGEGPSIDSFMQAIHREYKRLLRSKR